MIRRVVVFKDEEGKLFSTPEFNGDKESFEIMGSMDGCSKNWPEILRTFDSISTLKEFENASIVAQKYYRSFLGEVEILPIEEIVDIESLKNDEVYIIKKGKVELI